MDRLLDLTRQAEDDHFWYHGFRSYLRPVFAGGGRRPHDACACSTAAAAPATTSARWASYGRAFGLDLSEGGLALARDVGRPLVRADTARSCRLPPTRSTS